MTDRRRFLAAAAGAPLALLASPVPAHVDPAERRSGARGPFKLSVAAYSYRQYLQGPQKNMTLLDFIRRCAEMGSDGVELTEYYFEKPITPEALAALRRAAHLWGQTITGTPVGNRFTFPPGPDRDRELDGYRKWVDVSAVLGSPVIRTFAGNPPQGVPESDARRNVIECLEEMCDYAGRRGIYVAVENHGGVVATPEGLLEVILGVKSPWCGINLDTGNFHTRDPYADLARCAPYAVSVQHKTEITSEGQPTQPADFPRILALLKEAGYRGFITLEYEAKEDPMEAVPRHLAEMRKAILAG